MHGWTLPAGSVFGAHKEEGDNEDLVFCHLLTNVLQEIFLLLWWVAAPA